MANITNKHIAERLDCIEQRLPNGELKEIHENVKEIKAILLDPEDGIIVRVNKNTYWRRQVDPLEVSDLKSFKANVTKALWIIFPTLITIILYSIFGIK